MKFDLLIHPAKDTLRLAARSLIHLWRRRGLRPALTSFRDAAARQDISDRLLSNLVNAWDNHYSADHALLKQCIEEAQQTKGPILECGSGLSTLLLGLTARTTGQPVWALEHMPQWAHQVHLLLQEFRITNVELCVAELKDYSSFRWYSPPLDRMPGQFSLVICDGPPGETPGGRYGLLPVMRERFAPGCVILLDDAGRPGERAVAERWATELATPYDSLNLAKPFARFVVP